MSTSRIPREERQQILLGRLQYDVELGGSETVRRQRRAILRGMRVALWAKDLNIDAMAREFRAELFGLPPGAYPSNSKEDDGVIPAPDEGV